MIVLGVILALIVLFLLTKLGVRLSYGEQGLALALRIGLIRLQLLPKKSAGDKGAEKKAAKGKRPEKDNKPKSKAKGPKLGREQLMELLKLGLEALGHFRRALRVEVFHLRYVSGGRDPYSAAMGCAYARAAVGFLAPLARRAFRVGDSQVEITVDFEAPKPEVRGCLALSISIWQILRIAVLLAVAYLRIRKKYSIPPAAPKEQDEPRERIPQGSQLQGADA